MCGIAGLMGKNRTSPDSSTLDSLEAALLHRGPDGSGRYIHRNTAILQTRLAIIDLAKGDQPFVVQPTRGKPVALVANGEIYNYRELSENLMGANLISSSDCEPPLHLYLRDGVRFAESLRGMYAFAIYDANLDRLILGRDPFGIKPLYYVETGTLFAFASEPQALIKAGICEPEENASAFQELLQLQFTCGRETPFAGIFRVLPGETIVIEGGQIIERIQVSGLPMHAPIEITESSAMTELEGLFMQSVEFHQRSDVPYGMFFSGGVDSSALLAMMRRLNSQPVKAFTLGFDEADICDERDHARDVAQFAGAEHVEVSFAEKDFWELLPSVARIIDDIVADYATLPTFKLAQAVQESGIKVILSGEGGDEMFAGYGRYRRASRNRLLGGRAMRANGLLDGMGLLRQEGRDWRNRISKFERDLPPCLTKLQMAQATDCAYWLPNDLLIKLDRCLMAHGVEGRVPFVDSALAQFSFALPDSLKVRKGLGKWLLRSWLDSALPECDPFSKKRGFTVPVGEWIFKQGNKLGPLVASQAGVERYCNPEAVRRIFKVTGKQIGQAQWTLLFFALWHGIHMEGNTGEGDVFDALAA